MPGLKSIKIKRNEIQNHWFIYHHQSNKEKLFFSVPGDKAKSELVKIFTVKGGRPIWNAMGIRHTNEDISFLYNIIDPLLKCGTTLKIINYFL